MLKFVKKPSKWNVWHENGKFMGELEANMDGFYVYWASPSLTGYWDSQSLREIAKKLEQLNYPLEKELEEYFSKNYDLLIFDT